MLRDGEYAVWFRTPRGEGTGIIRLAAGRISGRDGAFTYSGTYEVDEDRFTATLTTRRHGEGPTTVFGLDEIEANLTGICKGATAVCSGTAVQAPDVRFEATLFPKQDQPSAAGSARAKAGPGIARLSIPQTGRFRPA